MSIHSINLPLELDRLVREWEEMLRAVLTPSLKDLDAGRILDETILDVVAAINMTP